MWVSEPGDSRPSPSCTGADSEEGLVYLVVSRWEGSRSSDSVLYHVVGLVLVWAGIAKNELKNSVLSSTLQP